MKKLFVLALIIAFAQSAFAVRHHEFAVSYGEGTHNQIVNGFANVVGTILTIGYADVTDLNWSGAYNFKYAFHPVNFVGLGVVTSYQTSKGNITEGVSKKTDGLVVGKAEGKYLTIMPTVSLNWFDFDYVCMYSRFAAGYSLTKNTNSHIGKSHQSYQRFILGIPDCACCHRGRFAACARFHGVWLRLRGNSQRWREVQVLRGV